MIFRVSADGHMKLGDRWVRCALGRAGVCPAGAKREGDGRTPAGIWPVRRLLWRGDRGPAPVSVLPVDIIGPQDGWCDAPDDSAYNRPVRLPYGASAERLWREDDLYDRVVILGHNDDPVTPGAGSAIFLHLARPDYGPTEGCIALARDDLDALLAILRPGDCLDVALPSAEG